MPRERAVLDSIALRKHDTVIISDCVKKNSISNLLVIGIIECADNLIFFFTIQFYQHRLVGFPTKPKKILGPKITPAPPPHSPPIPSNFRAVKFFRGGLNVMARQKMKRKLFVVALFIVPSAELIFSHPTV